MEGRVQDPQDSWQIAAPDSDGENHLEKDLKSKSSANKRFQIKIKIMCCKLISNQNHNYNDFKIMKSKSLSNVTNKPVYIIKI
jgi:hypothetical protein